MKPHELIIFDVVFVDHVNNDIDCLFTGRDGKETHSFHWTARIYGQRKSIIDRSLAEPQGVINSVGGIVANLFNACHGCCVVIADNCEFNLGIGRTFLGKLNRELAILGSSRRCCQRIFVTVHRRGDTKVSIIVINDIQLGRTHCHDVRIGLILNTHQRELDILRTRIRNKSAFDDHVIDRIHVKRRHLFTGRDQNAFFVILDGDLQPVTITSRHILCFTCLFGVSVVIGSRMLRDLDYIPTCGQRSGRQE